MSFTVYTKESIKTSILQEHYVAGVRRIPFDADLTRLWKDAQLNKVLLSMQIGVFVDDGSGTSFRTCSYVFKSELDRYRLIGAMEDIKATLPDDPLKLNIVITGTQYSNL